MKIDDDLIVYLENLSFLSFSHDEKIRLKKDLEGILGIMDRLGEINTANMQEHGALFDDVNAFRDDVLHPSMDRALLLRNTPNNNGETIIAPKTV